MKRPVKVMIRSILGLLAIGVVYSLIVIGLVFSKHRATPPQDVDTMIVLGAMVWGEDPAVPSPTLKERLNAAYDYLIENENTVVIVTGGQGRDEAESEGVVMGRYLQDKGISSERIIVENTSTSTIENIQNSAKLRDISTAIIVSNDYHIYRALRTANQNGVDTAYGLAAHSSTSSVFFDYVREVLALGYHLIFTH